MLDNDTNLRKLWQDGKLNNALRYVDKLMDSYIAIRRKFGDCEIRIGTTGTGHSPHYSFRVLKKFEDSDKDIYQMLKEGGIKEEDIKGISAESQGRLYFSGLSHKPLGQKAVGAENWSEPPMTYTELAFLRNDIERSEGKAKKPSKR